MERYYWKVSKDNLKFMPGITEDQIRAWNYYCDQCFGYIYICNDICNDVDTKYYMTYEKYSVDYFKQLNYEYKGEFNSRKNKLEKLQQLYGKTLLESE